MPRSRASSSGGGTGWLRWRRDRVERATHGGDRHRRRRARPSWCSRFVLVPWHPVPGGSPPPVRRARLFTADQLRAPRPTRAGAGCGAGAALGVSLGGHLRARVQPVGGAAWSTGCPAGGGCRPCWPWLALGLVGRLVTLPLLDREQPPPARLRAQHADRWPASRRRRRRSELVGGGRHVDRRAGAARGRPALAAGLDGRRRGSSWRPSWCSRRSPTRSWWSPVQPLRAAAGG